MNYSIATQIAIPVRVVSATDHVCSPLMKLMSVTAESVASTFLRAALSIDMPSVLSRRYSCLWDLSAQGSLFLVSSAHALRAIKTLRGQHPAAMGALRPQTIHLALCLTYILRHEVVSCHRKHYENGWHGCTLLTKFPWHGALESITDCLPVEMGALVRFVVQQEKMLTDLREGALSSLTALMDIIPLNEEADLQLRSELALIDAWPEDIVVSDLEPQGPHGKTTPALSHHGDGEAHGSGLASNPRTSDADGPYCPHGVIDVDSQLELPGGASTIAAQASTVHASDQKDTDSELDLSPEVSASDKEPAPISNPLTGGETV
jgi:hypothetical protein